VQAPRYWKCFKEKGVNPYEECLHEAGSGRLQRREEREEQAAEKEDGSERLHLSVK
jgi:hypothetical protein